MILPDATHPPTKPHTYPWVGNSSQISNFQTELKYLDNLKCYWIFSDSGGPPPGGWQMGGWEWGWAWVCGGCPMRTCMHMHARMHMHVKHAKHGCLHLGGHLQFLYMYKCACVHVCACGGIPPMPPDAPPPPAPSPELQGAQIRITITLERIKIIQFCLKVRDPWTFQHTYRLGLMCRWGVSYFKWHFYVFDVKKCSCDSPIKIFPVFALDPIRPYLDWALRGFLTS